MILVSGSDRTVHVFMRAVSGRLQEVHEDSLSDVFLVPELRNMSSAVTCADVRYDSNYRYIVAGCQDGTLQFSAHPIVSNSATDTRLSTCCIDGMVSSVGLSLRGGSASLIATGSIGFAQVCIPLLSLS